MFPGQPPFPLDGTGPPPPPRRPRRSRGVNMGDDDLDLNLNDDPMMTTNETLLLSWEERQRRARTVRLLVMFLTMLLLMDGDPNERRRHHPHQGRHSTRKYVPRPGEVSTTKIGPAGVGGDQNEDPEYEALRSSLVAPTNPSPKDGEEVSAVGAASERYRRVIESHPRFVELAKRNSELSGKDGSGGATTEADDNAKLPRKHYHYPRNATGYYRGVWTRVPLNPNPGEGKGIPADEDDGAEATAGKLRQRRRLDDDDDDVAAAGPSAGVVGADDDDVVRPSSERGRSKDADGKVTTAAAFDLDEDASAAAVEEDRAEQDRMFDLIRTAMSNKNDTVGVFLLPPGIASDPIPPPPSSADEEGDGTKEGEATAKKKDDDGGGDEGKKEDGKKEVAAAGGKEEEAAASAAAALSREVDASGAFLPRWKNLTLEAEEAEAAERAAVAKAGKQKGGHSSTLSSAATVTDPATATTFPLKATRGKLAIQLVLRPMVPPPSIGIADADGETDAEAAESGKKDDEKKERGNVADDGDGKEITTPKKGVRKEDRVVKKPSPPPTRPPELSLVEGYVKLFDNDGGILITTAAAAAGAGGAGGGPPGGRPPSALHSGRHQQQQRGAGAVGGLPPGGAGGSASSSAFVLRGRGVMINALGRISMVANADPGRGVVLLGGGAGRGGGGGANGGAESTSRAARRGEETDDVDEVEKEAEAAVGGRPPVSPSGDRDEGDGDGTGKASNATAATTASRSASDRTDDEAEIDAEDEAGGMPASEIKTERQTDPEGSGDGHSHPAAVSSPDDAEPVRDEEGGFVGGGDAEEAKKIPSRRRRMGLLSGDTDEDFVLIDDEDADQFEYAPPEPMVDRDDDHRPGATPALERFGYYRRILRDVTGVLRGLVDPHGIWTDLHPWNDHDGMDDDDQHPLGLGIGFGLGLGLGGTLDIPSGEHLYLFPEHDEGDHDYDQGGAGVFEGSGDGWDGTDVEVERPSDRDDGPPISQPASPSRRLGALSTSTSAYEAEISRSDVLALPVITQSSAYTSPISQAPRAGAGSKCEFEINLDVDPMLFTPPPLDALDTEEGSVHVRGTKKKAKGDRTITDVWDVPTDPEPSPEEREQLVVKMTGSIVSANCDFAARISSTALRIDWTRITTRAINYSFAMMLICLGQIVLLLRQLLHSQTNSVASRVSMAGVGWQCLLDAIWCVVHVLLCLVIRPLFMAFASVAFFKLLMFCVIEMKYMQIIHHARQASQGISMNSEAVRREAASLQMKFYIALVAVMILYWNMRDHWRVLVVMLHGFWLPQIALNVFTEARRPLHPYYLVGMSVTRLVAPLYVFGVRGNFIRDMNPEFPRDVMLCWILILWVGLQACVLVMQGRYGARFMIPARCLPPKFDYSRPIPSSLLPDPSRSQENGVSDNDMEIGGTSSSSTTSTSTSGSRNRLTGNRQRTSSSGTLTTSNGSGGAAAHALDCVICYGSIDVNDRRGYMLAPCDHIFHRRCLEQWMEVKMECPICRTDLPPI